MIKLTEADMVLLMDALQSYACGEIDFTNIYTSVRLYDKIGTFMSEAGGKEILLCTDDEPNEIDSQGQIVARINGEEVKVRL